jgi:hypothetical protein
MSQSLIERTLRNGFKEALSDWQGNTAFENEAFNPKNKEKWYLFTFIPNSPEVATLGRNGTDMFSGIVQVDINIKPGTGLKGLEDAVDALRAVFGAGVRLINGNVNIIVTSCGRDGSGRLVNGFYRYTVTIGWECRLPRIVKPDPDFVLWGDGENVEF